MIVSSEQDAQDNIDSYSTTYGARTFTIDSSTLRSYIDDYVMQLTVPHTYPSGNIYLRMYVGTESTGGPHNIVIVPAFNNFEDDWLSNYDNSFAALLGCGTGDPVELQMVTDKGDCTAYIASHSSSGYIVQHPIEGFDEFTADYTSFDHITFELAISGGSPIFIMRCRDSSNNALTRYVGIHSGVSFDEGNLVPPPGSIDSSF